MRISDWSSDVCSSDLHRERCAGTRVPMTQLARQRKQKARRRAVHGFVGRTQCTRQVAIFLLAIQPAVRVLEDIVVRSEEHTSELQSLMRISYAVFCLKNKKKQT